MKLSVFERVAGRYLRRHGVNCCYSLWDSGDRLVIVARTNRAYRILDAIALGLERRLTRTAHAARLDMRPVHLTRRGYGY